MVKKCWFSKDLPPLKWFSNYRNKYNAKHTTCMYLKTYLPKKFWISSRDSKIVDERDNVLASLNLIIGETTLSLPGSKHMQKTKTHKRFITKILMNYDDKNEWPSKILLEQPISPERLSSRTQGSPSTTLYIEVCRSGTDCIKFSSPKNFSKHENLCFCKEQNYFSKKATTRYGITLCSKNERCRKQGICILVEYVYKLIQIIMLEHNHLSSHKWIIVSYRKKINVNNRTCLYHILLSGKYFGRYFE